MKKRVSIYKKENLRSLRRYLGLTQKQFIEKYLSKEDDILGISIATYSNYESKDSVKLNRIIIKVSEMLDLDPLQFTLEEEVFLEQLPTMLMYTSHITKPEVCENTNVSQLLHVLITYFSGKVLTGEMHKGDIIESEQELSRKLGASKAHVKEALKVLNVLGVIDMRSGKESVLNSNDAQALINPLTWSLFFSGTNITNILEIRDMIQIRGIELAITKKSETFLNELHDIYHRLHIAYVNGNQSLFIEGDTQFHLCIAKGSGNAVFYSISETINALIKQVSKEKVFGPEQLKEIHEEHIRIFAYILAGDVDNAKLAMEQHVKNAYIRYQK